MIRCGIFVCWIWVLALLPAVAQEKPDEPKLVDAVFWVPPIGATIKEDEAEHRARIMKILEESAGVNFPQGGSAHVDWRRNELHVRAPESEMLKVELYLNSLLPLSPKGISVIYESIEIDAADYQDWIYENRITDTGHRLRQEVQTWIKAGRATRLETMIVHARSGLRARATSAKEVIYPTETDAGKVSGKVTISGKETKAPQTRTLPTAFETRDVGTSLEVDPVLGADDFTVDLNLAPEQVKWLGFMDWSPEVDGKPAENTVSMPLFHTMKTTNQVTLHTGRYLLLGTTKPDKASDPARKKPLVLNFVRADVGIFGEQRTTARIR